MKNTSNISINREQLKDYLMDFHPSKLDFYNSMFSDEDFMIGKSVFKRLIRSKISMPQIGKSSLNYWISRGWDEYEAEQKRIKPIVGNKSPMCIEHWLEKGMSIEEANFKIKSQRKTNEEYWISRGFSKEESIIKIKEFQTENSSKFIFKYQNDKKFRDLIKQKQSNNIQYWLNMGFSLEEAQKNLSNRQSTFSKEKCISKYGIENGNIIWKNRQDKWLESLSKSDYNGIDGKDSKSISSFKKKYGSNWVDKYIQSQPIKNKEFTRFLLQFDNYTKMIDYMIDKNIYLVIFFLKYTTL